MHRLSAALTEITNGSSPHLRSKPKAAGQPLRAWQPGDSKQQAASEQLRQQGASEAQPVLTHPDDADKDMQPPTLPQELVTVVQTRTGFKQEHRVRRLQSVFIRGCTVVLVNVLPIPAFPARQEAYRLTAKQPHRRMT